MSRVAKQPIHIPAGIEVNMAGHSITVKGSKGQLTLELHHLVAVANNDNVLTFEPKNKSKQANALSGTTRALVNNMVQGVSKGWEKTLELVGVGYRAAANGKIINLSLGYSHPVDYDLPPTVTAETPNQTTIILKSVDKQLLGQVAAEIRELRKPEPYKGKGVRYAGEKIRRKETKKK